MKARLRLLALGAALAGLACSDSAPPAAAPSAAVATAPDAARGKIHFENYCVSCHGPRGEGDGPVAQVLDPKPARLGDRATMSGKQDDYLFQVIKNGGASVGRSPMMAPWGGSLSDEQIRDVIAYVRSLAH